MTAAVLYLRVSTEEQVSNLSLDTQEQECRALCDRDGLDVVEVFREEGASAKTLERPAVQRLLAYLAKAKGRVSHLVVWRIDRLSRKLEDFYIIRNALRRHGVSLLSCRESIADETSIEAVIVEAFSALQAQIDNMLRAARAKTGMMEAARRGRWVWVAPAGYRHGARDANGRPTGLELDHEQAPLVRRAFDLVAAGRPVDAAHRELLAAGLKSGLGRPIARSTFSQMLRRRLYAGRLEAHRLGVESVSSAPAIVDEETFLRVQQAFGAKSPTRRRPLHGENFPLRGVARCSCGRRLAAYKARGQTGRHWPYYRCQRCRVSAAAKQVDAAFLRLLGKLSIPEAELALFDRMVSLLLDQDAEEMQQRLARARRQLSSSETRLARLLDMRADGEIGAEEYSANRRRALEQRDAAQLELADLTAPLCTDPLSSWQRRLLLRPAETWVSLTLEQQHRLAATVFPSGITYKAGEFSNPTNCLLSLPLSGPSEGGCQRGAPHRQFVQPANLVDLNAWRRALAGVELAVLGRAA